MRSLPLPDRTGARQHLTTAIEVYVWAGVAHGYQAVAAEIDAVIALYDDYDATLGVASTALTGPLLDQLLRTAIYDGYDFTQAGRKLSHIRTQVMRGVERCPICGISPPRELDHYLPRSVFNPLAVYVRNLVPICHDCNQSKSTARSNDPAKRFIHAYLEPLPAVRFLRAVLTFAPGVLLADFEIDPNAPLPNLTLQRLEYQFTRLHVNDRYEPEINTYLSGHTVALYDAFSANGQIGVENFLRRQAAVEFQQFHLNHWRPVLLDALANHPQFCAGGFQSVFPPPPPP